MTIAVCDGTIPSILYDVTLPFLVESACLDSPCLTQRIPRIPCFSRSMLPCLVLDLPHRLPKVKWFLLDQLSYLVILQMVPQLLYSLLVIILTGESVIILLVNTSIIPQLLS